VKRLIGSRVFKIAVAASVFLVLGLLVTYLALKHHHTTKVSDTLKGTTLVRICDPMYPSFGRMHYRTEDPNVIHDVVNNISLLWSSEYEESNWGDNEIQFFDGNKLIGRISIKTNGRLYWWSDPNSEYIMTSSSFEFFVNLIHEKAGVDIHTYKAPPAVRGELPGMGDPEEVSLSQNRPPSGEQSYEVFDPSSAPQTAIIKVWESPGLAKMKFQLLTGTKVTVLQHVDHARYSYGGVYKIRTSDGREGWIATGFCRKPKHGEGK
jgi:hypothetical protein